MRFPGLVPWRGVDGVVRVTFPRAWIRAIVLLASAMFPAHVRAAESQEKIWRLDTAVFATAPEVTLAKVANAAGVETSRFDLPGEGGAPRVGDSVAGLVTLIEPEQTRQWIVGLKIGEVDVVEETLPPSLTLFSSSGAEMRFESAHAAVDVRTLGPVDLSAPPGGDESVRITDARAVVNREFLALGFDRASQTIIRLKKARDDGRIRKDERISFSERPFKPGEIARGRDIIARAGLSVEDERAFAATFPALMTYVRLVTQTQGLSQILEAVVRKPSLWSVIWRFGRVTWNLRFESASVMALDPLEVGLPEATPVFQLPFTLMLNDQPALECTLIVAPPHPPLLTSAGIVGLAGRRPGSDERRLIIRLFSARRGSLPQPDSEPGMASGQG